MACAEQNKKVFLFEQLLPPTTYATDISQEFYDHPPLHTPIGKRETIVVYSPHFTLAIPDAMDMTGKSSNLKASLSDMLYTEIFNFNKNKQNLADMRLINLLDRGAFANFDSQIFENSLNNQSWVAVDNNRVVNQPLNNDESKIGEAQGNLSPNQNDNEKDSLSVRDNKSSFNKYIEKADGILLLYITSREGSEKGNIGVDYRIVINRGFQKKIVLLAGSEIIRYQSNTDSQIDFVRTDIRKIVNNIYKKMTIKFNTKQPRIKMDIEILKYDPPFIVIDIGKNDNLMPGMIGYVVEMDNSVKISERDQKSFLEKKNPNYFNVSNPHYSYIAEFLVTDVFDTTSNAILTDPTNSKKIWDVKVHDIVVIK